MKMINDLLNYLESRVLDLEAQYKTMDRMAEYSEDPSQIISIGRQSIRVKGRASECRNIIIQILKMKETNAIL